MDRLLRTVGIVATVALVGYALALLLAGPDPDEVVEDVIADAEWGERDPAMTRRVRDQIHQVGRGLARRPRGDPSPERAQSPAPPPASRVPFGSGELDPQNAREGFDYAMGRVDALVKAKRRITQPEWTTLYRESNDAFAALSIVLDASDPAQMNELEAAHKRLKAGLGKVRVKGKKLAF